MARHASKTSWWLRKPGEAHRTAESGRNGYVRTLNRSEVQIVLQSRRDDFRIALTAAGPTSFIRLDRRTARLLARRIIACLDETS